ncbi:MAG: hypothetical protein J0I17_01310 ['Candidatus Kapabacteria' thiocyanatum]|uniref:Uncharacterized protein n=1 Tax=Candidatus Kapaibacterium thiocyanatum TaxID=1895771 RepID=A0A1M3KWQ4_9BACT|nr:hypothetical protein ['Candidatus Kapabacteria' thiocyanatum]OJX56820.1 MAG: hypothetical protein BGO89_09840 ['Candidatus Kapabacteria' thiocyanatum]
MKAEKILEELTELARSMGYTVRRETGTFKGGACVVREQQLIIVNRTMPPEAASVILARALCKLDADDQFVKPAVREILQRERAWIADHPDVTFEPRTQAA